MADRERCILILSKTVEAVRQFNENVPIIIGVEFAEDILELLKDREIVRCKDCRYWVSGQKECHNINSSMFLKVCTKSYFCADGEV